ncbi:unnamed protein product [Kluyveromyces dobzhanskii CBS 2104]|uniref:WGS project CCBQ000000000 data, contig 00046 n=1 Tax=Kluyveromyces dobzhanskii CBS 2104 TaxID=1427455 RepID=A0A0A8L9I8_9SACH|nr:unnamed protein product [Kluyveromyces dobzhanskii CBS 2104]
MGDEIPSDLTLDSLWLKIKNIENVTLRAAYLMGPYVLYADVRSNDYHHDQRLFVSADQPQFESNIQPQQDFIAELSLHNLKKRYVWVVDVASQILFTRQASINFAITVGGSKESIHTDNATNPRLGVQSPRLKVDRLTTADLWNTALLSKSVSVKRKEHLIVLTHGLHSNVTSDLFYLKEQIERTQSHHDELLVVKGFTENVCKTEKGIKWLGTRLAEHIVHNLRNEETVKISFIGHSLGGLVQSFAIAYISYNYPTFFENVEPVHFITLASPMLGTVSDNAVYIQRLLAMGIVGRTGQDLSLQSYNGLKQPLLQTLSKSSALKRILRCFRSRTLYANACNDGIVPLYTSALLFLDYDDVLDKLGMDTEDIETDFFQRNFVSPITKAMNILVPQRFSQNGTKIPVASMFDSAYSVLIPPLPAKSYITDPNTRKNVVVHDKMYTEKDLPDEQSPSQSGVMNSSNVLLRTFNLAFGGQYKNLEEQIARNWHEGIDWRKVIINLKPDAHNNIITRRRFSNAYGWPIVDHLIENHFSNEGNNTRTWKLDPILKTEDFDWIVKPTVDSVFDVGPTGMICTFGEMLGNLKSSTFEGINENLATTSYDQEELFKYEERLDGNGGILP